MRIILTANNNAVPPNSTQEFVISSYSRELVYTSMHPFTLDIQDCLQESALPPVLDPRIRVLLVQGLHMPQRLADGLHLVRRKLAMPVCRVHPAEELQQLDAGLHSEVSSQPGYMHAKVTHHVQGAHRRIGRDRL